MASNTNVLTQFSEQLSDLVSNISNSVVGVRGRHRNAATGVLWQDELIVTSAHAIRRKGEVKVVTGNGEEHLAKIAGIESSLDLALLKIEKSDLKVPEIDDTWSFKVGNLAVAAGRGSDGSIGACLGMIGNVSGPWHRWGGTEIDRYIELDMRLVPGFSGSPLLNTEGKIIGTVTRMLSSHATVVIPADTINGLIEPLLKRGTLSRGYIGVGLYHAAVPAAISNKLKQKQDEGLVIISLEEDGPAENAGVMIGDIFLSINGESVTEAQDVQKILAPDTIGNEISVTYLRGGEEKQLNILVSERPQKSG